MDEAIDVTGRPRLYTTKEVAQLTFRAPHTVAVLASRYRETEEPIGFKVGRDWLFTAADVSRISTIPPRPGRPSRRHDQA